MTERDELTLLRALLRASDYGVLLSDAARRDQVCNQRFCEMFGLEGIEALQADPNYVRVRLGPRLQDPDGFFHTLETIYADPGRVLEDEIVLTSPRPRLLRRYTAPVLDPDGAVIGRLWTFQDVTRSRQMEDRIRAQAVQLREQSRRLAASLKTVTGKLGLVESTLTETQKQLFETEKLSAVGLLAASVAHDIRNLLTPLPIELSLADQDDGLARAESLGAIRRQVDSLSLLTHRLLALARPAPPERTLVDLPALLERLALLVRPQAALEDVRLVVTCGPRQAPVIADGTQIEQVLVNLILNAIQAMRATAGGTLSLRLDAHGGGARLRVADTGPGIPPALRQRLFEPFFSTRPDGAGLGLFSCRRIAGEHGGTVTVRNRPGGGTQFTLWLPAAGDGFDDVLGRPLPSPDES